MCDLMVKKLTCTDPTPQFPTRDIRSAPVPHTPWDYTRNPTPAPSRVPPPPQPSPANCFCSYCHSHFTRETHYTLALSEAHGGIFIGCMKLITVRPHSETKRKTFIKSVKCVLGHRQRGCHSNTFYTNNNCI